VVPRGHIDDWNSIFVDTHQLVGIAKKDTPGAKAFLLGHSMGSQAVRGYGITCPNDVDGIISTAGGIGMNRYGNGTPQARGDRGEEPYRGREAR
jgi:alpha-beta hydrolase superfamily lysophospholipase